MELRWRQCECGGVAAGRAVAAGGVAAGRAEQQQTPAANTRLRQTATLVLASCEAGLRYPDAPASVEGSEAAAEATMDAASAAASVTDGGGVAGGRAAWEGVTRVGRAGEGCCNAMWRLAPSSLPCTGASQAGCAQLVLKAARPRSILMPRFERTSLPRRRAASRAAPSTR